MSPKEQKAALFWLSKKNISFPNDGDYLNDVFDIINRKKLNFQNFTDPEDILTRDGEYKIDINRKKTSFNPDSEPTFSHKYNAGDGVTIYEVEDSKEGMMAVREAVDAIDPKKNPWCLISRKNGLSDTVIDGFSKEDQEVFGLLEEDESLSAAWEFWKNSYNAYPKRVAFKNGKIFAMSANDDDNVLWFDMNNRDTSYIPNCNANDDQEFIKKHNLKTI